MKTRVWRCYRCKRLFALVEGPLTDRELRDSQREADGLGLALLLLESGTAMYTCPACGVPWTLKRPGKDKTEITQEVQTWLQGKHLAR